MKRFITVIIIIIITVFILRGWWSIQLSAVSPQDKATGGVSGTKVFVVAKGSGVSEVAKNLKEQKLIRSELAFKIYVRQKNLGNKIQAGSYKLSPSMSVSEILSSMQSGSEDIWITLIEGWRVEEMAEKLNGELKIDNGEFLKNAREGYMFPDTYLFPKQATAQYIADTLKNTFDSRLTEELKTKFKEQGLSVSEAIILASIVEREARSDKARTEIAGILLKRLKIKMGLNADATIQYALGYQKGEKSWWKRNLTGEDLKVDSKYNTYLHAGLPPAPIANPSLSSIKAVANANSSTPYLYYYHDSKGVSHYGRTLEEHNQNTANYP